jgi:alpha-galactosidase
MLDRRTFLLTLPGASAASTLAGAQQKTAAAHPAPFQLAGSGVAIDYIFSGNHLRQRLMTPAGYQPQNRLRDPKGSACVEVAIQVTGENHGDHRDSSVSGSMPGQRLVYESKQEQAGKRGQRVMLVHRDPVSNLRVESHYEFFDAAPMVRRFTRVKNEGSREVGFEFVSSAMLNMFAELGSKPLEEKLRVHFAFNCWKQEAQWQHVSPSKLGLVENGAYPTNAIVFNNVGSWSTMRYLPMGMVENLEAGLIWFWQIEHNGSWHWEISRTPDNSSYAYIGGPDEEYATAWKNLRPGETYQTVPVAVGCVRGGFPEAVEALTKYRRYACIRPHPDNTRCPVIFNDYMNCLEGDPTTAKELPLIDAAAAAGCEYFVIDCGWYAEQNERWWDAVGLWQPSKTRWSQGLPAVIQYIRDKGMMPGLWLELEVAGVKSPLASKPDAWFFMRHGKRVIDDSRFLLDFRNPEVRAFADEVVERLVKQYGAGYIKMDYNVTGLMGTDLKADSPGQGMLEHQRAYLAWLDSIYVRHPELVIENCGSGGGRLDYAMLSRLQLQSSSDQTDYRTYPALLGALAGCLPEQLAVWSYPLHDADADQASFNMVNAMLCRIHQSGHLAKLSPAALAQVKDGIRIYKETIRANIPGSIPFFPLGTPDMTDRRSPIAVGIRNGKHTFIAVWRLQGSDTVSLAGLGDAEVLYPAQLGIQVARSGGGLQVKFPRPFMGAILQLA